ncbi:MAG: hypothetical protein ABSE15_00945 [Candidatus Bathyarchaeia archaeon]|jgi:hypothetical protein
MSEDDICKKKTGQLASALPTKSTFDAEVHKQDLIEQREKRNMNYSEPTVAKPSEVYVPSKNDSDADGMKEEQDLSEEYAIKEGKKRPEKGTNNSGIEPSPLNQ